MNITHRSEFLAHTDVENTIKLLEDLRGHTISTERQLISRVLLLVKGLHWSVVSYDSTSPSAYTADISMYKKCTEASNTYFWELTNE